MEDNLQEFLRKAAERRRQQSGEQPVQAQPIPAQPVQPQPPQQRPVQAQPIQAQPVPIQQVQARQRPAEPGIHYQDPPPVQSVTESVSNHVQSHLQPAQLEPRQLGSMRQEPSQIDGHLHETFDHRIGHLSQQSISDAAYDTEQDKAYVMSDYDELMVDEDDAAGGVIASLLASPDSIQKAFIFSEIIQRPTHRWTLNRNPNQG